MRQLYLNEPSMLDEALETFTVLRDATYATKAIGSSAQIELMACDCANSDKNHKTQCGPDSGCINRLTCIECTDEDCGCSSKCQNRRFQRHSYAKIDVFWAGRKGYGVRALEDISKDTFIYEYTGEVVDEARFNKRKEQYDEEGMQHFYFMMLQKDQFIDATMRGSIARFCNHSCSPNAYVEKWVVGPKLRMGLFAKRHIVKGEEITFDYKVDRYGARAQRCLCGADNCVGYLGGRQQTGGVALPPSVVDALSLEPEDEEIWRKLHPILPRQPANSKTGLKSTATKETDPADPTDQLQSTDQTDQTDSSLNQMELANKKKPTEKEKSGTKTGKSGKPAGSTRQELLDENSAEGLPAKPIEIDDASHIMSFLLQEREQWLVRKIVQRILNTTDPAARGELMRLHGYNILGSILKEWKSDDLTVERVLETFLQWPRLTRNKISTSDIESTVGNFCDPDSTSSDTVKDLASRLLEEWSSLEMGYRIPKREKDANAEEAPAVSNDQEPVQEPVEEPSSANVSLASKLKRKLPPDWEMETSANGRIVYVNRKTKVRTYAVPQDPRDAEIAQRKEKERQRERERQRAILEEEAKQRKEQQSHIQRIIEQANVLADAESDGKIDAKAETKGPTPTLNSDGTTQPSTSNGEKPDRTPKKLKGEALQHSLAKVLAGYISKLVFKHEEELGRDRCKRHARDLVHSLSDKESRRYGDEGCTLAEISDLNEDRKKKIKLFVHQYMKKVVSHHANRKTQSPSSTHEATPEVSSVKRVKM